MGYEIIKRKNFTNYGVGCSVAKIIKCVLQDQQDHLPVGILLDGQYGESGVVASVLTQLGRKGVMNVIDYPLSKDEILKFQKSCDIIRNIYYSIDDTGENHPV